MDACDAALTVCVTDRRDRWIALSTRRWLPQLRRPTKPVPYAAILRLRHALMIACGGRSDRGNRKRLPGVCGYLRHYPYAVQLVVLRALLLSVLRAGSGRIVGHAASAIQPCPRWLTDADRERHRAKLNRWRGSSAATFLCV